jgi:hypothetical protein
MEPSGLLKSLALDTWYKVVMYVGIILFAVGLTLELRGMTNSEALLVGLGMFLVGLGEWKNHKTAAWIKPPNVYTGGAALMQAKVRQPDLLGVLLDLCGFVALGFGLWHIVVRTGLATSA